MSTPPISIIIPVYNAADTIEACLRSMLDQDYPAEREIIIVDNKSTDNTLEIVKRFPVKIVLEHSIQGPSAARNKGVEAAKHEALVFFDADQIAPPDYLRKLLAGWEDETIGAFSGLSVGQNTTDSLVGEYWIQEWNHEDKRRAEVTLQRVGAGNLAMRKSAFNKLGGFDIKMLTSEDIDLGWRLQKKLGLKIRYNRDAASDHKERVSLKALFKREFRFGVGGYILARKHPDQCLSMPQYILKTIKRDCLGTLAIFKKSVLLCFGKSSTRDIKMVTLDVWMSWIHLWGRINGMLTYRGEFTR